MPKKIFHKQHYMMKDVSILKMALIYVPSLDLKCSLELSQVILQKRTPITEYIAKEC